MSHVMRKPALSFANYNGADQPAHPRSLISAVGVRWLDSIILVLDKSKIFKALASLCSLADLFESYLVAKPRRQVFS